MTIGERVKFLRTSLKLTQQEFANALDVDQGHIAGIEKGSKNPSKPLQKVICFTFYVNDIWLKTGEGKIFVSPGDALKNLMARFGEQAIAKAFNKECLMETQEVYTITNHTKRDYDKDPDLKRMIDALYLIYTTADERTKTWISVQFDRAFPSDIVEEAEKKQQETARQSSAG